MKTTSICPKCDGRKIYAVPVQQTYCDAGGSLKAFHLTGAEIRTGEKGIFGGDSTDIQMAGPLEAYVCAACGYVEWNLPLHAMAILEKMLTIRAVRLVQPQAPKAPFR